MLRSTIISFFLLILLFTAFTLSYVEAKENTTLKDIPNYPILSTSHAASTAVVLSSLGALKNDKRPPEVLVGNLETAMYRCGCRKVKNTTWVIAQGIREWALLEGWQVTLAELCLKSNTASEVASWGVLQQELQAGRPVIVSFAFDEASSANLIASQNSTKRFSGVLTGMHSRENQKELTIQLPLGWETRSEAADVQKLFGITLPPNAPAPTTFSLPWPPKCPNVTFTLVRDLKRPGGV